MAMTLAASDRTELVAELTGSGTPVVFVHGSNGGLHSWIDVGRRLLGHQIVRYARRNHAPSGTGPSPNSFAVEAADLATVLDYVTEAAGRRAHVVGGSYGASVALHAARVSTARIASLALFEPPLLLSGEHLPTVLDKYRKLCAAERFDDALDTFAREVARVPPEVLAASASAPTDPEASRTAAIAACGDLEGMASDGSDADRWASIDVPVLLMQGGQSWTPLPEGMDRLAAALPHAQRVTWPDQSHFATATAPERVASALQEFIGSVSTPALGSFDSRGVQ